MSESSATPEPCTTTSNRKRHYSTNLTPGPRGGRTGLSLCRGGADVYDQEAIDAYFVRRSTRGRAPKRIADLPECGLCAKSPAVKAVSR